MVNHGTLRIAFPSTAEASDAAAALAPDDGGAIQHHTDGQLLIIQAESASIMGLLRSLDDALTCLRVLEGADEQAVAERRRP